MKEQDDMSERELLPCPFCDAAMVEFERGNYAEHPWSEAEDFCHMRGFAVHKSRYGWWNRRSPSRQLILEEAAKVADEAQATAREEIAEEKAEEGYDPYAFGSGFLSGELTAAVNIAKAIRALKEKNNG